MTSKLAGDLSTDTYLAVQRDDAFEGIRPMLITVRVLDCTPGMRHDNFGDRLIWRMTCGSKSEDPSVSDGVQIESDPACRRGRRRIEPVARRARPMGRTPDGIGLCRPVKFNGSRKRFLEVRSSRR